MLGIRSISFLKTQKYNKVPRWFEIPIQSHMLISLQNLLHMQLAISLSFVKLLWPLVRFISYSHDQDHIHIHTICYASTLGASTPPMHPQNKNSMLMYDTYHWKLHQRIWGYTKRKKEIKYAYSKKICHMPRYVQKKVKKIKEAYPNKVCRMFRHVKKKRRDSPYPKERKRDSSY